MAAAVNYTKSFSTTLFEALSPKGSAIKDLFKGVGYVAKWAQLINPQLSANYVAIGDLGTNGKNLISLFEMGKNGYEAIHSTGKLFTEYSNANRDERYKMRYTAIKNVCDFSSNAGDTAKLASRFFTVSHMKHVEGVCGAFTLVGAVNNLWEHVRLLLNPVATDEQMKFKNNVYNVINVISDICYAFVGACVTLTWLGLISVPPAAVLLLLTIALTCSLINFFFKNLGNLNDEFPDNKKALDAVRYQQTHVCAPVTVQV